MTRVLLPAGSPGYPGDIPVNFVPIAEPPEAPPAFSETLQMIRAHLDLMTPVGA